MKQLKSRPQVNALHDQMHAFVLQAKQDNLIVLIK